MLVIEKEEPVKTKSKKEESNETTKLNHDEQLELLLEEKKQEWANITSQIHAINSERDCLELQQKKLVKELTDIMNNLQKDESNDGFILDVEFGVKYVLF